MLLEIQLNKVVTKLGSLIPRQSGLRSACVLVPSR
jgi:hypothetical protein